MGSHLIELQKTWPPPKGENLLVVMKDKSGHCFYRHAWYRDSEKLQVDSLTPMFDKAQKLKPVAWAELPELDVSDWPVLGEGGEEESDE